MAAAPTDKPALSPSLANGQAALADGYKYILSQKGSADVNVLTNNLTLLILQYSVRQGASDVHFEPQGESINVRFRIDGDLHDRLTFSKKDFPVTAQLRVMAGFSPQAASAYSPEDGAFGVTIDSRNIRFRASSFPTIFGDKLVIRLLDMGPARGLDQLGFSPEGRDVLEKAIASPSGIFLISGLTGGGKTTTLFSILEALHRPEINIMTLEDPVEYQMPKIIQSSINTKAGFGFADGLRSILRQDPNIIMVGEIRDFETAEIAMRAALTGHLIFSTIHTISTIGTLARLMDMGIKPFLITASMIGALAQRLVKKVCPACAEPVEPAPELVEGILRKIPSEDVKPVMAVLTAPGGKFLKGKGCPACFMSGYKGRVGVFETMILTPALREMISKNASLGELRQAAISGGMKTALMDGAYKAWTGVTSIEEVDKIASDL